MWMGAGRRPSFVASPNVISVRATAVVGKWILEKTCDLFPSRAIASYRLMLRLSPRVI